MSKIIVTEFVSRLDGVAQDPHKVVLVLLERQDREVQGVRPGNGRHGRHAARPQDLRSVCRGMAQPDRQLRGSLQQVLPKLVASRTLKTVAWSPSKLLADPIADSVAKAKKTVKGAIYVHGSLALSQELAKLGLVDEYHLLTYAVVLGEGQRLFGENQKAELELISLEDFGSGVVAQKYRVKR